MSLTVGELIIALGTYPSDLKVGLVNLSDDDGASDEPLTAEHIDIADAEDVDGNPIKILAISHSNPNSD